MVVAVVIVDENLLTLRQPSLDRVDLCNNNMFVLGAIAMCMNYRLAAIRNKHKTDQVVNGRLDTRVKPEKKIYTRVCFGNIVRSSPGTLLHPCFTFVTTVDGALIKMVDSLVFG